MKVQECMTKKVELASPQMTLKEAAQKMREGDFGFMPIGENDKLVGVITDRDIAIRAVARGLDPSSAKVKEVCSNDVLYCFDDQTVEDVAHNMGDNQIRRLPVLNRQKRMVGVVSLGDLAKSANSAKDNVEDALCQISKPGHRETATRTLM
ncbi:MAG: CBS domain-containing protein [Bdellovibrionales bacterium]